jgi:DNA-binding CsgD family transcriptional regulator
MDLFNYDEQKFNEYKYRLTKAEKKILNLIASGIVIKKEIAAHLNLSIKTVETHLANIYKKFEIENISSYKLSALTFLVGKFQSRQEERRKNFQERRINLQKRLFYPLQFLSESKEVFQPLTIDLNRGLKYSKQIEYLSTKLSQEFNDRNYCFQRGNKIYKSRQVLNDMLEHTFKEFSKQIKEVEAHVFIDRCREYLFNNYKIIPKETRRNDLE